MGVEEQERLAKLIHETLINVANGFYAYLINDIGFLDYIKAINNIYSIRSHQIIAKCAVDYAIHYDRIGLAIAAGRI